MAPDWWRPLGRDGRVEVADRVDDPVRRRIMGTGDGGPLEVATIGLPDAAVRVRIDRGVCEAAAGETVVAALRIDPEDPTRVGGTLLGEELSLRREADASRGSRIRGPLMFWALTAGGQAWSWHYEDTRNAADTILGGGARPGGDRLVVTSPGHASAAERADLVAKRWLVGRWTAGARPVDVVLAELVDLAGLGDLVRTRLIRGTYTAMDLAMWWFKDQSH